MLCCSTSLTCRFPERSSVVRLSLRVRKVSAKAAAALAEKSLFASTSVLRDAAPLFGSASICETTSNALPSLRALFDRSRWVNLWATRDAIDGKVDATSIFSDGGWFAMVSELTTWLTLSISHNTATDVSVKRRCPSYPAMRMLVSDGSFWRMSRPFVLISTGCVFSDESQRRRSSMASLIGGRWSDTSTVSMAGLRGIAASSNAAPSSVMRLLERSKRRSDDLSPLRSFSARLRSVASVRQLPSRSMFARRHGRAAMASIRRAAPSSLILFSDKSSDVTCVGSCSAFVHASASRWASSSSQKRWRPPVRSMVMSPRCRRGDASAGTSSASSGFGGPRMMVSTASATGSGT
mmetsp:Transcript_2671/g.8311  ORF Transcript_2671/g.8311 Transcript_2671/m.8311 type:complete len:351 (-) Transcript_2671:57-1109(-)